MMKLKYFLLLLLLTYKVSVGMAQSNADKKEQIASLRMAFITRELDLNTKEAQSFWPVYNEYLDKLEAIRLVRKKDIKKIMFETLSDKDAEIFIENETNFRMNEATLQKQYYGKFKQVLPIRKVALLMKAEEDFKKELLKQLKEKNQ